MDNQRAVDGSWTVHFRSFWEHYALSLPWIATWWNLDNSLEVFEITHRMLSLCLGCLSVKLEWLHNDFTDNHLRHLLLSAVERWRVASTLLNKTKNFRFLSLAWLEIMWGRKQHDFTYDFTDDHLRHLLLSNVERWRERNGKVHCAAPNTPGSTTFKR